MPMTFMLGVKTSNILLGRINHFLSCNIIFLFLNESGLLVIRIYLFKTEACRFCGQFNVIEGDKTILEHT